MNKLKKVWAKQGEFSRNLAILMSGTTIAQLIPVFFSPILTRIFDPAEFAIFGVFLSLSNLLIVVSTGRYERAIMLPKDSTDALNLVVLACIITISLSTVLLVLVIMFGEYFAKILNNPNLDQWLVLLPLMVLLGGLYQTLNVFLNRSKKYKALATTKVSKTSSTIALTLGISTFKSGPSGLIVGSVVGQASAFIVALIVFKKGAFDLIKNCSLSGITRVAREYRKFPLYDTPNTLVNKGLNDALTIEINRLFSDVISGNYVLMRRILGMPISFFVTAFSDVFYQKLSENQEPLALARSLKQASRKLALYVFVPFFLCIYTAPLYVTFVFGPKWEELYKYIYIFSPVFFLSIVLSPYGNILRIINRQELGLYLNLFKGLFIVAAFYTFTMTSIDLEDLFVLSSVQAITGAFSALIIYYTLVKKVNYYLLVFSAIVALIYFVNYQILF